MENVYPFMAMLLGLVLRIGIPVFITVLVVLFLRWLDERWQKESVDQRVVTARNIRCWDIQRCSEQQRASCSAYAHPEVPCWQHFRDPEGALREQCLGCQVFLKAPVLMGH